MVLAALRYPARLWLRSERDLPERELCITYGEHADRVAQRVTKPDGPAEPIAPADAYSAAIPAAVTDASGGQPQTNTDVDADAG